MAELTERISMSYLKEPQFQKELEDLINKYSLERFSKTPDFILAKYMADCLHAFNQAVEARYDWYSQDHPITATDQVSCDGGGKA
jgi:hypothetical protein